MNLKTALTQETTIESADTVLLEKVRWSIRQRLRKQMAQLTTDFFDEVDDFLFDSGKQGQLDEDCIYLNAMRELRTKQGLFEETFLDTALEIVKAAARRNDGEAADDLSSNGDVLFEEVEIDLAIKAMTRKAEKFYQSHIKQIESLNTTLGATINGNVLADDVLIKATLTAFAEAQSAFSLVLSIRLVFIKLFEQHFLLKMEKLFLDIISILNNVNDKKFVEKLYTSSSAFKSQPATQSQAEDRPDERRAENSIRASQKAETVELAVNDLVAVMSRRADLPQFVEKMLRSKWRSVMFLIGLNRGVSSRTWQEAKHTVSLLIEICSNRMPVNEAEWQSLTEQIQQGFGLTQMPREEQQRFLDELEHHVERVNPTLRRRGVAMVREGSPRPTSEASVSPAGEEILDQEDLNEIAKLMGGGREDQKTKLEKRATDYLPDIDLLVDGAAVEYLVDGLFQSFTLQRHVSNPDLFNIINKQAKVVLTRSRLGLAISMLDGEMKLPGRDLTRAAAQKTLLESSSPGTLQ